MRIAIDISQIVYEGTGVSRYVRNLTEHMIAEGTEHKFILFGSSFGRKSRLSVFVSDMKHKYPNVEGKIYPLPLRVLDFLWNTVHLLPAEWFTGTVDCFISSDWVQPPLSKAVGITTIHDLSVLKYPEQFHKKIVAVQIRRLKRAVNVCCRFLCDSEATKKDLLQYYGIDPHRIRVIYPGLNI